MESDYESEEQSPIPASCKHFDVKDGPGFGTAVDLETLAGLQSPPAKRVRRHSLPAPSDPEDDEGEDGESEGAEEDSDEESVNSFILDIFHAERTEQAGDDGTLYSLIRLVI